MLICIWSLTLHPVMLNIYIQNYYSGPYAEPLSDRHKPRIKMQPHTLWKHPFVPFLLFIFLICFFWQVHSGTSQSNERPNEHFLTPWHCLLTYDLVLTYKLDMLPLHLHAKIQSCMSVCLAVRARHTHSQAMPKLLHPSLTRDVIRSGSRLCSNSPFNTDLKKEF